MRGRNTENLIIEKAIEMAGYQQKRYVIMKFIHDEKHIVFNNVGKGRRKKEVYDGIEGYYSYELMLKLEKQFNNTKIG